MHHYKLFSENKIGLPVSVVRRWGGGETGKRVGLDDEWCREDRGFHGKRCREMAAVEER